jgi:two-component system, LytTR family, response regulator LytT
VNVKIICKKENYDEYAKMLESAGFTINEEADLIFREQNYNQESIVGRYNQNYEIIPYQEVHVVESFGHDIILHTCDKEYGIKEKLFEIEGLFEDRGFVRVNKSTVINKHQIKEIRPKFNMKFQLLMKNGKEIDVTRSYYNKFREYIGF